MYQKLALCQIGSNNITHPYFFENSRKLVFIIQGFEINETKQVKNEMFNFFPQGLKNIECI